MREGGLQLYGAAWQQVLFNAMRGFAEVY